MYNLCQTTFALQNVSEINPQYVSAICSFFFFFVFLSSIPLHEQTLYLFFFDGCLGYFHFGIVMKKMAVIFLT